MGFVAPWTEAGVSTQEERTHSFLSLPRVIYQPLSGCSQCLVCRHITQGTFQAQMPSPFQSCHTRSPDWGLPKPCLCWEVGLASGHLGSFLHPCAFPSFSSCTHYLFSLRVSPAHISPMVIFMCHLDRATGCPWSRENIISGWAWEDVSGRHYHWNL